MDIIKIKEYLHQGLKDGVFPGYAVGISHNTTEILIGGYESITKKNPITRDTLFDLASLSKPLATTLACLALIKEGVITLDTPLKSLLNCSIPSDKKNITLASLLSHSAGFIDHAKFYRDLEKHPLKERRDRLLQDILNTPLACKPGTQTIYSDLGFILLLYIIELKAQTSLEKYVENRIFAPLDIKDICYLPKEKGYTSFAATENCSLRNKELYGEVHDQNTAALGGISGQAGLFSTVDAALDLVTSLRDIIKGRKQHPFIDSNLLKEAMTRQTSPKGTCWGLGFDTPSQPGSSAGQFISTESCGHLGFTGTSFWIDFEKDIAVVLLSNRINPSVDNLKIRDFRPLFHDLVFR